MIEFCNKERYLDSETDRMEAYREKINISKPGKKSLDTDPATIVCRGTSKVSRTRS